MGVDRRSVLASLAPVLATVLVIGCSRPGEGREEAADSFWTVFRNAFVDASGRVVDRGNGGISHSEGQGYGLLLAVLAGDKGAFQTIYGWTEANLGRQDIALYAWKFDPRLGDPVSDPNNATDGDMLIGWALAEAARRWNDAGWRARSAAIRAAIRAQLVIERHGRHLLLPGRTGFSGAGLVTLNPSYFIWPALDAFAALDGDGVWGPVIDDAEAIVREARFGASHLPCDWIEIGADGKAVPSRSHPPRFGYDAIRIPLYALAGRRASLVQPIADFWRGQGAHPPAWIDVISGERAAYPLSAGGMAIVRRTLGQKPAPEALDTDYFSAALQALTRAL
ncbi:glycosyl hydrolase family 8 [Novosphingobium sp. Fuku2-ISO-50]|uniref:glycosyl hydrolase family 8 n=1 Tax=Novosphingobium sp. Fuku2-ISO-50 TaxID=1739114 RepID=UPI00076D4237|nr:glycosyl hydrolase family 8 [Novosphingobium sp. Fuku2-ISO-50]KUR75825.1 endoglucanase [Novosphingobium sp. Fuku2-ISO-50]